MKLPQDDWLPKPLPWDPPNAGEQVVYAVRAFAQGKATDHQQRLLWEWLGYVTGTGDAWSDLSFRPGGEEGRRHTDFAEGKRFVGLQLRKQLHPSQTPLPKPAKEAK